MSSLGEIKSHIGAIEQTRQITNAMYLISASKMRSTIKKIDYNVKYMARLRSTMKDILLHTDDLSGYHFIRRRKESRNVLLILVTGDKGMCGGYNLNAEAVFRDAEEKFKSRGVGVRIGAVGIVGEEFLESRNTPPDFRWRGVIQDPTLYSARQIASTVIEEYDSGRADEIYMVYTKYRNSAVQTADIMQLLPIELEDYDDVGVEYSERTHMNFEPSPKAVFANLVPQYLIALIFNMLVQSSTGEYAARMNAMQTSTSNADEMLSALRSEYNRTRQLDITNEIIEIAATTGTVSDGN